MEITHLFVLLRRR